jgi:hypothetical protein
MKFFSSLFSAILVLFSFVVLQPVEVSADKVCLRINKRGKLVKREVSGDCRRKFTEILNKDELGGDRIWGDGSAGSLTISTPQLFQAANSQFTSLTVNEGVTWTFDSGVTLKVKGTCNINGAIVVREANSGGRFIPLGANETIPAMIPSHQGLAFRAAGHGAYGTDALEVSGGLGGIALILNESRNLRKLIAPSMAGGSGGAGRPDSNFTGGGGGGFALYCKKGISISATGLIKADGRSGDSGQGGGAGGLIILASQEVITSEGTISVRGGQGGESTLSIGAGGGGGGGIVHVLAPSVQLNDSVLREGGLAGSIALSTTLSPRFGGGGGGALGGSGGRGSTVNVAGASINPANGSSGLLSVSELDPTSLLF